MIIDDVHRGIHKNQKRKRVGRGVGSGHGKTCGRGHKGAQSRRGYKARAGFDGGQKPVFRRVAKRGFNNAAFATKVHIVNLDLLEKYFEAGETVSPETLSAKGLVKAKYDALKVLSNGDLSKKLTVRAHRFSVQAAEKITQAGGTVETIVLVEVAAE